ncbi:MAG: glycoside hydrolase family 5 protein, partial [Clostridia bacterium]|nr:glycoside hydrolase family 5 protein [Clostridia bacterium]
MFRRIMIFAVLLTLVHSSSSFLPAGTGRADAAHTEQESGYGLIPSEDIVIPVFAKDDMKEFSIPDNEALRFTRSLKAGWNLGNTFDAMDEGNGVPGRNYETYWSGAKTSRELIHALKEAGFNLIRIPVSWHNHVTGADYVIDASWMNRIREVAQWIVDEDMYFIINIHHDNSKKYLYPDTEHYEQSEKYITAIWKQVADSFSDFDDHCIFESMNEPRLVGTENEWWLNPNAPACQDAARCINLLNQKFVDTVRESGGNNAVRYLLVPGYCGSPDGAVSPLFTLPDDSAENRIIIEVHAYTPYDYALNRNNPDSSFDLEKDKGKKSDISSFMNNLYTRYIDKGIPVLIDEFGALKKNQNDLQGRVNFAAYYTASASIRGMT